MENAVKTSLRSLCIYYLWDPLLIHLIVMSAWPPAYDENWYLG
jgi:hypothetical protein